MNYAADRYLSWDELEAECRALAARYPGTVRLSEVGRSRQGRPLLLLTIGCNDDAPAVWVDGGTHCAEWAGVMSALFTASRWAEAMAAGQLPADRVTAHVMPCMSPDGYDAMRRGAPYLRSTLRPPRDGRPRVGLDPCDIDGDGVVRWMRWRHPAGSWCFDDATSARMRPRTLQDAPGDAFFVCSEGSFLAWDGATWTTARLQYGMDLNRNFPGSWAPFEMFGMDGGDYPLSEPESRAVVDAFRARPRIAAAVTNHTYTGALLTQPYRQDTPLGEDDILLMERLANEAVRGTGYRVLRTFPDFTYDPKKPIVGVWADTMSTAFGLPGYTLELWDPFAFAGVANRDPGRFWTHPDPALCGTLTDAFAAVEGAVAPWRPFVHPQLGAVEIGGLDVPGAIHNPPEGLLRGECERGFAVADRLLRALPQVRVEVEVSPMGAGLRRVRALVENLGFLSTSGLAHSRRIGLAPPLTVTLVGGGVEGEATVELGWLDGWAGVGRDAHPLYPSLPVAGGPRRLVSWLVRGDEPLTLHWDAGRGGKGELPVK